MLDVADLVLAAAASLEPVCCRICLCSEIALYPEILQPSEVKHHEVYIPRDGSWKSPMNPSSRFDRNERIAYQRIPARSGKSWNAIYIRRRVLT